MQISDRYKQLFKESRELGKMKPLSDEARRQMKILLDELDAVWTKLSYRDKEEVSNWCAAQSEWLDD